MSARQILEISWNPGISGILEIETDLVEFWWFWDCTLDAIFGVHESLKCPHFGVFWEIGGTYSGNFSNTSISSCFRLSSGFVSSTNSIGGRCRHSYYWTKNISPGYAYTTRGLLLINKNQLSHCTWNLNKLSNCYWPSTPSLFIN